MTAAIWGVQSRMGRRNLQSNETHRTQAHSALLVPQMCLGCTGPALQFNDATSELGQETALLGCENHVPLDYVHWCDPLVLSQFSMT